MFLLSNVQSERIVCLHTESTVQWEKPDHPIRVIQGVIVQGEDSFHHDKKTHPE